VIKTIFIFFVFFIFNIGYASDKGSETLLDIPRYVSLKSNDSNLRVGPSKNYPILLKYIVNNLPLKIIDEYENWREIIDIENNTGWIHKSLLKGERFGIIINKSKSEIFIHNIIDGKIIGNIEKGNIVHLSRCSLDWCLIKEDNFRGWVEKNYIWGVKEKEVFNINFYQKLNNLLYRSINYLETLLDEVL